MPVLNKALFVEILHGHGIFTFKRLDNDSQSNVFERKLVFSKNKTWSSLVSKSKSKGRMGETQLFFK